MGQADIGVVGLAVMGRNLVLNMDDHGFVVAVTNRTVSKVDDFLAGEAKGTKVIGAHSLSELVSLLKTPRKVMLMVKAGAPVDAVLKELFSLLEPGDMVIDGGNSNYHDTERRVREAYERGIRFVGCGVSGGEEGARYGPSLMPGGAPEAWPHLKPILQAIAAKAYDGKPCCEWIGKGGAGHFVKMVHNGIEYGDIQLICEAFDCMKNGLGLSTFECAPFFSRWNEGKLDSYLIEITADILKFKDEDSSPLVDKILDTAGQKGTGKWTAISALDLGVPLTLISEAVFARFLSARKGERVSAAEVLGDYLAPALDDSTKAGLLEALPHALYAAKIMSYSQGYMLLKAAAEEYDWELDFGSIAMLWRAGCIIRSRFLDEIKSAFDRKPGLVNLMLDPYFAQELKQSIPYLRTVVEFGVKSGICMPGMASALAFYDGYRRGRLPANLLQALRDYFGAHTYERVDQPRGKFFHTDWTGHGGKVTSGSYSV